MSLEPSGALALDLPRGIGKCGLGLKTFTCSRCRPALASSGEPLSTRLVPQARALRGHGEHHLHPSRRAQLQVCNTDSSLPRACTFSLASIWFSFFIVFFGSLLVRPFSLSTSVSRCTVCASTSCSLLPGLLRLRNF